MKKVLIVCILLILISCNQNNSTKNTDLKATDEVVEAHGILMNADTIRPAKVISAGIPQTIKANDPKVIPLKPNQGEAGGITLMQNYTTDNGLALDAITFGHKSAMCDKTGSLWFGTNGGGVSRYDGKCFTNFTTAQGLANNVVYSITEDKTGNLWFGTNGGGVSSYDGSRTNHPCNKNKCKHDLRIQQDLKEHNNELAKSFTNFTTAQGLANNVVYSITEDKTGNIWFGTNGEGVSRYDGNRVEAIERGDPIAQGTQQDLKKVNGKLVKSFTNFTTAQGLANNVVYSITEDKTGNLWFGTNGGVSRYDGSRANHPCNKNNCKHDLRIQQDLKKHNKELAKVFTNFTTAQGMASNDVRSITEDKTGNLWFGTEGGGVSRYDGSRANHPCNKKICKHDLRIQQDLKKHNKELAKSFTNFTTAQGLANNVVYSITEDKTGNLWFGTYGGGVSRYDGKCFTNFTTAQGLPDNTVTQIIITKEHNIAIATNFGVGVVVSFNRKRGLSTVEGLGVQNTKNHDSTSLAPSIPAVNNLNNHELKSYEPVVEIYNSATGYPVKDVNSGGHCMFIDSKGIIWMATGADKTALVRFDYEALNKNPDPPAVIIQSIKINEENICWYNLDTIKNDSITKAQQEVLTFGKTLTEQERERANLRFGQIQFDGITKFYPLPENLILPYKHNHISFEFAAIEPARPYLVKYQYFLEGYDEEWSPLTNKTDVSFGNIYEGTYTFKLKARSPFGIWSEPITYTFKVLPPWWRIWWMYTLYVIVAIAVISIIVWWNSRKLKARAKELTVEIKKATVTIIKQKEIVEEQKKVVEEKHKEITDSINYAERIQRALLASKKLLDENLNDYFILFKPKDVVSGDFYWATKLNNQHFVLVTADSTGHGVPGAIMSILNIACLDKAVTKEITKPDLILNETRSLIIENLKNDGSDEGGKDGMDGSLLSFDFKNNVLHCASANNPIWVIRDKELIEIKADRLPIGKHDKDKTPFTLHTLNLQKGDVVYSLTDGFPDQFGGASGKKFKYKKLQDLLLLIAQEPMATQKQKLNDVFDNWKGNLEQVDDVCLIGIRI